MSRRVAEGFLPRLRSRFALPGAAFAGAGLFLLHPLAAAAAETGATAEPHVDWGPYSVLWVVPFAGLLLSIALMPLALPRIWHDHFGKIAAFWSLAFIVPFTVTAGVPLAAFEILHTFLLEYLPFIVLLFALYTLSGGVRLRGTLSGTPAVNTGLLAAGTIMASIMGTTGAAMLLVRPLLNANRHRRYRVHVLIFFIFLAANIGGSLTPLGDPPLFLGFLKGVHFFWPTEHLLAPMAMVAGILLALFFAIDSVLYRKEELPPPDPAEKEETLAIHGIPNLILLFAVVGAVLMSGVWDSGIEFHVYHVGLALQDVVRDVALIVLAGISLHLVSGEHRAANAFTWFPIIEVALLFAGIFLTIIPAIGILRAGEHGALSAIVSALSSKDGQPIDYLYFWVTGGLSSFLDNAPTYLVFFNMAGGDAATLMGPMRSTLTAISAGAVFMGAMTYIGNAPNFMVRSIAAERGVAMPSFFGYMVWSCGILLPVFALVTLVFL